MLQFPIDTQDVRKEVAEFVNLEDSVSVHDMPTTESIIATIEEELSESEDFPIAKSISHKSASSTSILCFYMLVKIVTMNSTLILLSYLT